MTLRPEPYGPEVGGVLTWVLHLLSGSPATAWITFDLVEFTANVVMFVPLGVLTMLWGGRWWLGILIGLALSSAIETTQLLFLPTRVADLRDVVANTSGAAIGVAAWVWARRSAASQRSHNQHHRKLIDSGAQ